MSDTVKQNSSIDPQQMAMDLLNAQRKMMQLQEENSDLKSQLNDQQKSVMARLIALRKDVEAIGKANPVYKRDNDPNSGIAYYYRSIDDFYNSLQPLLNKHNVGIVPHSVDGIEHETFVNKRQTKQYHEAQNITYRIFDETGSFIHATVRVSESSHSGRISLHNMSFGQKVCFIQVLQVPVEEMSDKGNVGGEKQQQAMENIKDDKVPMMDYALFSKTVDAIIKIYEQSDRDAAVAAYKAVDADVKTNDMFKKKIGSVMDAKK